MGKIVKILLKKTQESDFNSAYEPWTEKETEKLRIEYESGIPIAKIARNHGRTRGAIRSRLKKEGLSKKNL